MPAVGSEVTYGLMTGGRATPQRHNRSCLAALMVGLALLALPTAAHALTCVLEGEMTAVALCRGGACTAGFKVEDEAIPGTLCKPRPAVHDLTRRELANFMQLIRHLDRSAPAGTYRLIGHSRCFWREWRNERCLATVEITRLADASARTLAQHEAEWAARTRRAAMIQFWGEVLMVVVLVLLVLAWPWILVMLRPRLRRHLLYLALAALPLQIVIAFPLQTIALIFGIDLTQFRSGDPYEGPHVGLYLRMLIVVVVPLQFAYLFGQRFKLATR